MKPITLPCDGDGPIELGIECRLKSQTPQTSISKREFKLIFAHSAALPSTEIHADYSGTVHRFTASFLLGFRQISINCATMLTAISSAPTAPIDIPIGA